MAEDSPKAHSNSQPRVIRQRQIIKTNGSWPREQMRMLWSARGHCKTQTSLCSTHTPIFISVSPTHDFGRKRDLNHSDLVLKQRLILLCVDRFFRRCRPLRDKPFRHQKTGSDTKFVFFQISIMRNPCTRSKTVCSDYPTSPSDPKLVPVQFRDSLKPPEQ